MLLLSRIQLREGLLIAGPALILIAFGFWFAYQFVEPAPPSRVRITTGSESGAYHAFGHRYAEVLARSGIVVEVLPSKGSIENLGRLRDPASGVSMALIQGGIANAGTAPGLMSLGRLFPEPIWIFTSAGASPAVTRLADLKGLRVAVGPEGSGTRAIALELLKANAIDASNATLLPLGGPDAAAALEAGEVNAAILVLAPKSPVIQRLLRSPAVSVLSLDRAEAYTRLFPYLSAVRLPAGVIDLVADLPPRDVQLLAAEAALVAREDTHHAIVGLMVGALREVHEEGGMFQRVEEYPKPHDPEFTMSEDAERLYKQGPPFLQRYLPFWLANFIERMFIMIVPFATILIPLFKVVPWLYEWRIRQRILYWYGELKRVEKRLAEGGFDGRALIEEIAQIEEAVSRIPVPLHYSDKLFELRGAVDLVRQRIAAKAETAPYVFG